MCVGSHAHECVCVCALKHVELCVLWMALRGRQMKDPPLLIPGMLVGWVNNECGQSVLKLQV